MRRYDDPVEVRRGRVPGPETDGPGNEGPGNEGAEGLEIEAPEQFLWRGRLWKVRGCWRTGSRPAPGGSPPRCRRRWAPTNPRGVRSAGDLLGERELWRVEAGRGGLETDGVFDLAFDWSDGRWQLVGCAD